MLVSEYSTDVMQRAIDDVNSTENAKTGDILPATNGINPTYSVKNKWVGYIPIQNVLGKRWNNLELNLTRFSIPQMEMGSTTTTFKGYEYARSTHVMDSGTKEITFDYIVDDHWINYKSLYAWMSGLEGNINKVYETDDNGVSTKDTLDVRVWLIDPFKNRILDLCFHDAWIKIFQDLALESNSPELVTHSFTMMYSRYELVDFNKGIS